MKINFIRFAKSYSDPKCVCLKRVLNLLIGPFVYSICTVHRVDVARLPLATTAFLCAVFPPPHPLHPPSSPPPTLLRDWVFADPSTLISKNSEDRELEQAVRFLHDNGTMLHYEDPILSNLYFVDPQWLVDMLAHIVTVREINPLVKEGELFVSKLFVLFGPVILGSAFV